MANRLHSAAVLPLPHLRPAWIDWAWLAFATVFVVVMIAGYLRASRSFWHLACERSSSLSSQRA